MSADFTPDKKDYKILPPFKMQVLTNFPYIEADFDALTNYQLLCKVVEYLNMVKHNENELTEEVEGLYNAYVSLQNYVNNYFDNLDIQEEVNNKLDEMAESGELTDIIAQYLGLAGIIAFNNVAEMKAAENLVNGSKCITYGFYSINDGGGAKYRIRNITNLDVVDEITLFALHNENLVAELIIDNNINILTCGAKKDGTTDTSTIINTLINKYTPCNIYIPSGDYLINNTIYLDTATKIFGDNEWKTRIFTNSNIVMIQNKNDDIAACYLSDLYIDGNNQASKGVYIYRDRQHLVYNDSRSYLRNLDIKKCNTWCLQIGDPAKSSNVIEMVVDNIYVHEFTGGGIYISKCSDSHFSNMRSGTGKPSTSPCILVEGYNLHISSSKAFLSGSLENPVSGWVFNGGADIVAEIEAQANSKHGVEIKNTKDGIFNIIADKNSVTSQDYAAVLLDTVNNCDVTAIVSNNVETEDYNTTTGCKVIEPKKLTLTIQCNNDINRALDLSHYNDSNVLNVNSKINIDGYEKQDITPAFNENPTLPAGITLTKINNDSYLLEGSVASDSNIWISGAYGNSSPLTYLRANRIYELETGNYNIGMSLYHIGTNLGGGWNKKLNGVDNSVTGIMITVKAGVTYNHIITPKIYAIRNTSTD